jgi:hypothetical protein
MGASAAAQPSLIADGGQFFSVPIYAVFDTRTGLGESGGVAQPLAAGATVQVQVTGTIGKGSLPSGIGAVVADIAAINPTGAGYLTAWDSDSSDPGVASVGIAAGVSWNQTDTVPVSASGAISLTNHSSGTVDMQVAVTGYYSGAGASTAGSTYAGVSWSMIADSSTGLGTAQAPIPAHGSRTIQVGGQGGIPASAGVAVLQVNAFSIGQPGYLSVYPAGSADPNFGILDYAPTGPTIRNLFYVKLSSSGQVTITNWGSGQVGFTVYTHGYFLPASASPAAGEYRSFDPDMLVGTSTAGVSLAAGASLNFQVGGDDSIPSTGAAEVAEDVIVTNPAAAGQLWAGNSSTGTHPVIGFTAGNGTGVGYDQAILIPVSGNGQETILNSSTGTVQVQVAAIGYYQAPHEPGVPNAVAVTRSGTSATVTWSAPATDGGSPITGYTVTASPDPGSVTVDGGTYQATLTGLASASADSFSVTAANAVGASSPAIKGAAVQTVSGTVTAPSGAPVAGATVTIEDSDPPSVDTTSWTPDTLGTATTDANGTWSFTVPSYASLSAGAQTAAANNGGYLNVDAYSSGSATVSGTQYPEVATGFSSAWVGTASQSAPPGPGQQASIAMTMAPIHVTDQSSLFTAANEAATYASLHDPSATDSNGNFIADGSLADTATPTDAYGYQEIGGTGNYNPYIAADGTNLSTAAVTPNQGPPTCSWLPWTRQAASWGWTDVGEQHAWRNATGWLTFTHGASTSIAVMLSVNGGDFKVSGSSKWTTSSSFSTGIIRGPKQSYINQLAMNYAKNARTYYCTNGGVQGYQDEIVHLSVHSEPSNPSWNPYRLGPSVTSEDGQAAFNNSRYPSALSPQQQWCNTSGVSYSYGTGATVFGIGIEVTNTEDSASQQCIKEGTNQYAIHYVMGDGAFIWQGPRRFFSY